MNSVLETITKDRGRRLRGQCTAGCLYVAEARNLLVGQFLRTRSEWLWMLDTDVSFGPDALEQTLAFATDERKILAAPYWSCNDNGPFCTWMKLEDDGFHYYIRLPAMGQPMVLGGCGMGFTLIHREVIEVMAATQDEELKGDPWVWFGHDLLTINGQVTRVGEDLSFCARARRLGYLTWGCPGIVVDHYKVRPTERVTTGLVMP
jgi:hypothetical protein